MPNETYTSELPLNMTTRTDLEEVRDTFDGVLSALSGTIDDTNTTVAALSVTIGNDELVVTALAADVYTSLDTDGSLKAGAVDDASVLSANVVTTAKILDANVTTGKIADGAVTTAKITDANVTTGKLADGAVTTVKITDANITTAKIADLNVTTGKIAANAVTTAKLAADAVTANEIATGAVGTTELAAGSVTTAKIAAANVTSAELASNSVTTAKITDANVTTDKIADANVTTAKIADSNVTGPKIADTAVVTPNLWDDPTFTWVNLNINGWKSRSRFQNRTALSIVYPDSDNPSGGRSVQYDPAVAASGGGVKIYLDEKGIAVGNTLKARFKVFAASGNWLLAGRYFDAAGVGTAAQVSGTQKTFSGGWQDLTVTLGAVPSGTVSAWFYITRVSGSVTAKFCEVHVTRADFIGTIVGPAAVAAPALDAMVPFPALQDTYGRHLLYDWHAQLAKIQQAVSGEQAVAAIFGDSWVDNRYIHGPLVSALQTLYGNAGAGWISFMTGNVRPTTPSGTSLVVTGTVIQNDQNIPVTSVGVDIAHTTSSDTTTPGKYVLTTTSTDISVHYLKQSGGGKFRWNVDGGAWTTVDTANATNLFATLDITGLSNASHVLTIEITDAGTTGSILMGADCKITGSNGVRIHKLGNGGLTAAQAVAVDATIWEAGIAALAPNLVIVLLGTNDHSHSVVPSAFGTDITTLVARIRAARSTTDILLLSPSANGLSGTTYTIDNYADQLRDVAVMQSTAMKDMRLHLPSYTLANTRGLMSNTSHLNASGGQVFANELMRTLAAQ